MGEPTRKFLWLIRAESPKFTQKPKSHLLKAQAPLAGGGHLVSYQAECGYTIIRNIITERPVAIRVTTPRKEDRCTRCDKTYLEQRMRERK